MAPSITLGLFFAIAATVVALAMLLLVVWQAPRRRENQFMAAYLLTIVGWGAMNVAARLGPVARYDSAFFARGSVFCTGVGQGVLFWMVTHFARVQKRPWVRIVRVLSVAGALAAVPSLFAGHHVLLHATVTPEGLFRLSPNPLGVTYVAATAAVAVAALACIWAYRHHGTAPLLPGAAVVVAGFLVAFVLFALRRDIPPFAVAAAALASVCFTYAILRENLFNPLARSAASLTALIDNTDDPVWSVDGGRHLTAFNAAFATLLERAHGVAPARGDHAVDILPPDGRLVWARLYERVLRGERFVAERHYAVPGVAADLEVAFNPIVSAGAVVGAAVVARDVTAHKRSLVVEARAREAAEAISEAKSRFLANLSSVLRAPIEVLLGVTRTEVPGPVQEAARGLRGLIDDVRDLSEIEAGRVDIAATPFALRRHLAAVVQPLAAAAAAGKGLRLAVVVADDVPDRVVGDPRRLGQVVAGLLADAVALADHDEVVLRISRDPEVDGAARLRLELDGVAAGMLDRLGFALAARLVEAMGGVVAVEGDGTPRCRVVFTLGLGLDA